MEEKRFALAMMLLAKILSYTLNQIQLQFGHANCVLLSNSFWFCCCLRNSSVNVQ